MRKSIFLLEVFLFLFIIGLSSGWALNPSSLAVFNFRPTSMDALGYDGELLYALSSNLDKNKSVNLMPRREMELKLRQAGMTQSDNMASALRSGKKLNVSYLLIGQVSKSGSRISAHLQLLSIPYQKSIKSWSPSFNNRNDILQKSRNISKEIIDVIQSKGSSFNSEKPKFVPQISNLKLSVRKKEMILSWKFNSQDPISQFIVYRSSQAGGPFQQVAKVSKNIYKDSRLNKNRNYYYKLGIILHDGQIIKSDKIVSGKFTGENSPEAPIILEAKGYVQRAAIKFIPSLVNQKNNFKIKKYELFRKQKADDNWKKIKDIDQGSKSKFEISYMIEDKDLEDGKKYEYCLKSLSKKNQASACSESIQITTISKPELTLEQDNMLRRIDIKWKKIENIKGYNIYRFEDNNWQRIGTVKDPYQILYQDQKGLEDGKEYKYIITTFDDKQEGQASNQVKGKTKDPSPAPQGLQAQSGLVKSVRLSWIPANDPDVAGYALFRGTNNSKLEEIEQVKGNKADTYLDKGSMFSPLLDGQKYYYAISAINQFKAQGPASIAVQATTKPRPQKIKNLGAKKTGSMIQITWSKPQEKDISEFTIFRTKNGGLWSKLGITPSSKTIYKDYDLKPDSIYVYKIIAKDRDGLESNPAETKPVKTPPQ